MVPQVFYSVFWAFFRRDHSARGGAGFGSERRVRRRKTAPLRYSRPRRRPAPTCCQWLGGSAVRSAVSRRPGGRLPQLAPADQHPPFPLFCCAHPKAAARWWKQGEREDSGCCGDLLELRGCMRRQGTREGCHGCSREEAPFQILGARCAQQRQRAARLEQQHPWQRPQLRAAHAAAVASFAGMGRRSPLGPCLCLQRRTYSTGGQQMPDRVAQLGRWSCTSHTDIFFLVWGCCTGVSSQVRRRDC